jgi:hypothetical protein
MSSERQRGVDPNIKDAINTEGFEGDERGGATLIIGKKETGEIDRLRENTENEGRCADAATYVRLNKKVSVPAEEVPEEIKKLRGKIWIGSNVANFIDSQGNIAEMDIDYDKIASIPKSTSWQRNRDALKIELAAKGFSFDPDGFGSPAYGEISNLIHKHREILEQQSKVIEREEFDF